MVGAPWCTLCFADLRPKPAPAESVVASPIAAAAPSPAATPVASPIADPLDAPVMKRSDVKVATAAWPCPLCGAAVPIDSDLCTTCGGSFLGGVKPDVCLTLPLVGNVLALGTGQRWALTAAAATAVTALLFGVLFLLGSLL